MAMNACPGRLALPPLDPRVPEATRLTVHVCPPRERRRRGWLAARFCSRSVLSFLFPPTPDPRPNALCTPSAPIVDSRWLARCPCRLDCGLARLLGPMIPRAGRAERGKSATRPAEVFPFRVGRIERRATHDGVAENGYWRSDLTFVRQYARYCTDDVRGLARLPRRRKPCCAPCLATRRRRRAVAGGPGTRWRRPDYADTSSTAEPCSLSS